MPVSNNEIATLFELLANLLEIEDANPFRVRAYRNAARTIRSSTRSMSSLIEAGQDLSELPNIGKDLAARISTIVATGKLPLLEQVEARVPPTLNDLLQIEGLGPKRVKALYRQLNVRNIEDLKRALRNGRIQQLEGFGRKTEASIRQALERFPLKTSRFKLIEAEAIALPLLHYLQQCRDVGDIVIAGSYRRCQETVGDLDILITATSNSPIMDHFVRYDEVREVLAKGKTRATVVLNSAMQVDLRIVPRISYGAALHYFTGSKAHNIAIRKIGVSQGCKINEYGIFRNSKRLAGKTEAELYARIGLPFIPPELRENRGEIAAASLDRLPNLITLQDIRGDLHCHTNASDGHSTLEAMAATAAEKGYQYLSINDHSKRLTIAHGLDKKRLLAQIRAIDRLNEKLDGIVILKSSEVDIMEDGSLDLPDDILKELDFTVCAVHYKFSLPSDKQTQRIIRAMDNPFFNILAHPSGRLINERQAYPLDLEAVLLAARERRCIVELNAHPDRLDLNDEACKLAKDLGVRIAISTDAHSTADLEFMRFGINQARRGWLEARDVINCLPLKDLKQVFKRS